MSFRNHQSKKRTAKDHLLESNLNYFSLQTKDAPLTADATPANPKKGAKGGQRDMDRYKREFEARVL